MIYESLQSKQLGTKGVFIQAQHGDGITPEQVVLVKAR